MTGAQRIVTLRPGRGSIDTTIAVPGSKSFTNRSLIMAAQAKGTSTLVGCSRSTDSDALIAALERFGVGFERLDGESIRVAAPPQLAPVSGEIDVGPAGTTMRFLIALAARVAGTDVVLRGSERMHQRPIGALITALRDLGGVDIEYLGTDGCPPVRVRSRGAPARKDARLDGTVSSQFFSALLLTAPCYPDGLTLSVAGEQVSRSYLDMTLEGMSDFSVSVVNRNYAAYAVPAGSSYKPRTYRIEGDASGASYCWGLAAISGGRVQVRNLRPQSTQGDVAFPSILERMGCSVTNFPDPSDPQGFGTMEVQGPQRLRALAVNMELMPDTAQTLAVLASVAEGVSVISGLSTLRGKETDRIQALVTELGKLGVRAESDIASITIEGRPGVRLPFASIATYDDHRMAMAFSLLGSCHPGIEIRDPDVVRKSFPNFWEMLERAGMSVELGS